MEVTTDAGKVCSLCGELKPLTDFYVRNGRCKPCFAVRGKAYREAHAEETRLKKAAYRTAHRKELAAKQRAYIVDHKEECLERGRAHYKANKATILEGQRAYYAAHAEQAAEAGKIYRKNNFVVVSERQKRWKKANPDMLMAQIQRRRARKAGVENTLTATEIGELRRLADRCHYCCKELVLTIDHVVPLVSLGAHARHNIVMACMTCNLVKNDRPVAVFLARMKKVWIEEGNTEALAMLDGTAKSPCTNVHCSHAKSSDQ